MMNGSDKNSEMENILREKEAYAASLKRSNAAFSAKVKEFSIIKRHSQLCICDLNLEDLCKGILEIIIDETETENCSIWLVDGKEKQLSLVAAGSQESGHSVFFEEPVRILNIGEGAAGWVAEHGKSLLIGNVKKNEFFISLASDISQKITSLLCLPIKYQENVLAVLNLSHPDIDAFSKENELVLELITDQAGLALTNHYRYRDIQDFNRKLESQVIARTQDLRRSQERFQLAVGTGKVGVWDWHLPSDSLYLSPNLKTLLGYSEQELTSMVIWKNTIPLEDQEKANRTFHEYLNNMTESFHLEVRHCHKNGGEFWFYVRGEAIQNNQGNPVRMTGTYTDITELKVAEERLLYEASHDKLTGLPNRTMFIERLKENLDKAKEEPFPFSIFCFDLDRFKLINDSLGHLMGDRLLREATSRVNNYSASLSMVKYEPFLARMGGDEFAMILHGKLEEEEAKTLANCLQKALATPFMLDSIEVIPTASFGLVMNCESYDYPEELIRDADGAMNQAKIQGQSSCEVFQEKVLHRALTRISLENEMRKALKTGGQFLLYYQPIVSLSTGYISGFEALVRWHHPKRGMISPGEFIPIAEETGLINPLGDWILEEGCRQISTWHRLSGKPLYLSINLSTRQFLRGDLVGKMRIILEKTQVDAKSLKLELTESVLVDNFDIAQESLQELRSMKLKLLLDDFGTGYSSLSYLHRFPMDTLKIDRSFVNNMLSSNQNMAIVTTIKTLASLLHMDVVAEGIETKQQLAKLRELDCEYGQGYFFSRPLPWNEAEAMLNQEPQW